MTELTTEQANAKLAQEAWNHLSKTKKKSVKPGTNTCMYSGPGCAFSVAIKEGMAEECDWIEGGDGGSCASVILANHPEYLKDWAKNIDPDFADEVQMSHDYYEPHRSDGKSFIECFAECLKTDCEEYNVPVPEGISEILIKAPQTLSKRSASSY